MNMPLNWYRKIALSGDWSALVRAESEAEVRELHDQEQRLLPTLAQQYPGAYRVEALPLEFVPPEPLAALERRDFATVEAMFGIWPQGKEGEGDHE